MIFKYARVSILLASCWVTSTAYAVEVVVLDSVDNAISWLESERWWGEEKHTEQLVAPRALITRIGTTWSETSKSLPVSTKKEVFYRFLLPLIMHANVMVLERRTQLEALSTKLDASEDLSPEDVRSLGDIAVVLRIIKADEAPGLGGDATEMKRVIDQALYKLDVIPAGLALGQAAYESGYGTSRFASAGNALFGQWTFGGTGLVPEQQRGDLGDHRIAAFEWPFDSVRGYFINLSSHPAYEEFRKIRAELRKQGKPLNSLVLADGLVRYSERGQEYVDILKSIIRVNNLSVADNAVFRDEPMKFLIGAKSEADAARMRGDIETMRDSGELQEIIQRMALE